MTSEALRALITGGETLNVEFKGEEHGPLNDRDLVEAVICLANQTNTETRWLLIGVEDDGRTTGARSRHGDRTDPDRLAALVAARTQPNLTVHVRLMDDQGVQVLIIEVPPTSAVVGTSVMSSLICRKGSCILLHGQPGRYADEEVQGDFDRRRAEFAG
jgi:ATP-dependent DNA helicase RecG